MVTPTKSDEGIVKIQLYLHQVDAEKNGDAVKAVTDVAVRVLHQQLDRLPKDVVEDLQRRGGVKDEEFRHKQELTTGIVHHGELQENILQVQWHK